MKASEIFEGIPLLRSVEDLSIEIAGITCDSRKVKPGFAFVCLPGQHVDGRRFIPDAIMAGAVLMVCEKPPEENVPFVLVEDARHALPLMLQNFYHHPEASFQRMIAITGTNGKTTTSFMLKSIFDHAGCKTGLIGTTKYLIGDQEVPLGARDALLTTPDPELLYTLFSRMRDAKVDTVIMEASSHALALQKLSGLFFDVAIFTNLTQDHLDFHEDMDSYLQAKKSLFSMARVGLFNCDDPHFGAMASGVPARVCTFSPRGMKADFSAIQVLSHTAQGICFLMRDGEKDCKVSVPIPGEFTVSNALGAIGAARLCGLDTETILKALQEMHGVKGRIERILTDTPYSVFIDFAHTPDALENILSTLRGFTKGRLICLFGCGGDRDRTKRPMMGRIACAMSDYVIITSDNSRTEKKEAIIEDILNGVRDTSTPYTVIPDRTEAIRFALTHARKDDVILLAGKGHEEYEIDQTGKHPYSERKIVMEIIQQRNEKQ